jgi:hypothetical protein
VISWNFVATGLIFTCSGLFQALGNTWPSLLSSASRLLTFVVPVVLLSRQAHFELMEVWYLSIATVTLQALTSLALLVREFQRKLGRAPVGDAQGAMARNSGPGAAELRPSGPSAAQQGSASTRLRRARYFGSCPGCGSSSGKVCAAVVAE